MDPATHFRQSGWAVQWGDAAETPRLDPGVVHVWRVQLPESDASPFPPSEIDVLHADEIDRAWRFRSEELKRHFVRCRSALRMILASYLSCAPAELRFEYGEHGKPMLRSTTRGFGPLSPHFNLSHADRLALVAVTLDCPIGVDVERVRSFADADRLAQRFFAPREYAKYTTLAGAARHAGFFNCWTRKEAFVKARGEGLSLPLQSFEVTLEPHEPARVIHVEPHPGEAEEWSMFGFEPAAGYCAAVAAPRRPLVCRFFEFR
jgi:4'-phosphopantetheinyl transferase